MRRCKTFLACLLISTLLLSLSATAYADDRDTPTHLAPGLILAQGEDGTCGYVRATDLGEPMPESPEAALAMQTERRASGYKGRYIPLYAADGVTVIGRFFIDGGYDHPETGLISVAACTIRQASWNTKHLITLLNDSITQ